MQDPAPDSGNISLPLHVLQALLPVAQQMGVQLPHVGRYAPTVDVTQPISKLALELGRLVSGENIFLKGDKVITVDSRTGEERLMTARRFPAFCEQWAAFRAPGAKQKRDSLAVEDAGQILQTDVFLSCLRPLTAVHEMRLPVKRPGEKWNIEFLPEGYDVATGIFTVDALKYDMTWDVKRAADFLNEHGSEFCFVWDDEKAHGDLSKNRSWAVQVAAMLGVYCRAVFEEGTPRPIFLTVGNKPGTGKSTLVAMALSPVFGEASTTAIPKDEDRMIATLETAARSRQPYVFFDDVAGGIFNNALYQFVLARSHKARKMGSNEEFFQESNVTQVFATGNDMKFDDNLRRRALVVDLFLDTEVRGRTFKRFINPNYLAQQSVRAEFLAALCAIVRNYMELAPAMTVEDWAGIRPLESFEDWTGTIAPMVRLAGYADPLSAPALAGSGSEGDDEMRELLVALASDAEEDCSFSRKEMVDEARRRKLLEGLVGLEGEPEPDPKMSKRWGRQLQKYRGQKYVDARGRLFQFSHRHQKSGASYPLVFLDDDGEPIQKPDRRRGDKGRGTG